MKKPGFTEQKDVALHQAQQGTSARFSVGWLAIRAIRRQLRRV